MREDLQQFFTVISGAKHLIVGITHWQQAAGVHYATDHPISLLLRCRECQDQERFVGIMVGQSCETTLVWSGLRDAINPPCQFSITNIASHCC
jgi:hypothetical protein